MVWYSVVISVVLSTVVVCPGTRLSPSTDKVAPPEKRPSVWGASADDEDDDDPELGAGAGGGLCCASGWDCWPSAQYPQKMAHMLTVASVFRQSSWEMRDPTNQFNLNNVIRSTD